MRARLSRSRMPRAAIPARAEIMEAELRAVLCNAFEGIKSLDVTDAAEPHPAADEVLIDVHAASVSYMDYLIGDEILVPQAERQYYDEKIACLPNCYQVNDRKRLVSESGPTRAAMTGRA